MVRSKRVSALALLLALALLAACADTEEEGGATGQEKECTWVIGTMGALSGDNAAFGVPISQGVEFAVAQADEAGELPCRLELQKEDSQGAPDQAPQLAQKLADNEQLLAVAGPYFSGETLASGDIFTEAGVLFTGTGTNETIDEQGFTTWFRAVAPDDIQAEVAADYIVRGLKASKVAVIHDNQDYSKGLAEGVVENLEGVQKRGPLIINPEESDYSAVVSQVKQFAPDLVYYGGYTPQAGPLARQLQEADVDAQFLSDDAAKDPTFGDLAGSAARGVQVTCACTDPTRQEQASEFVRGMRAEYGPRAPGTFAADMYDVTNIMIDALKELGGEEPVEEVRARLVERFDRAEAIRGVAKSYTWDETGEFEGDAGDIWVYEWSNSTGDFVSLGPANELIE